MQAHRLSCRVLLPIADGGEDRRMLLQNPHQPARRPKQRQAMQFHAHVDVVLQRLHRG